MRQEFDSTTPREEQLARVAEAKRPGRKHLHQRRGRAIERAKNSRKRHAQLCFHKAKAFHAQVRAYWTGERDTNPAAR